MSDSLPFINLKVTTAVTSWNEKKREDGPPKAKMAKRPKKERQRHAPVTFRNIQLFVSSIGREVVATSGRHTTRGSTARGPLRVNYCN